jgi:PIN domain nuclease of toxin-antitoxin system
MTVLGASALLAFLFRAPGHTQVATIFHEACISAVNLAEVLGRFARDGQEVAHVLERLMTAGLVVVPFSREQAVRVAALLPITRPFGLSLGDRACMALALTLNCPAMTTDRTWLQVKTDVTVLSIR